MDVIRVVWGTATGPAATASYDAALEDAGVHDHNLVSVSSIVPRGATVEVVGEAPELGPTGSQLTVVEARSTVAPGDGDEAAAGLSWACEPDGPGVFYEAHGTDPGTVRRRLETGLEDCKVRRDWSFEIEDRRVASAPADPDAYTTAVVLAVYGRGTSIF